MMANSGEQMFKLSCMSPTLKSFKSHAFNLSRALSLSFFLQSCLNLNNLTLPIPFSATRPTLHHTLCLLGGTSKSLNLLKESTR